ncbi:piggyBac transposable element-derived protein 4-like [Centruroides sculpturatus]|uniref:piggyBac transposable element-derived protein 4-like n=1 Tax=Centruroides sculpturatus TaxID=218467 RepID=UPI000C6DCD8B|nr:piggyBac transposable element-derived protein 4-like [Centruroides sculpturatus]
MKKNVKSFYSKRIKSETFSDNSRSSLETDSETDSWSDNLDHYSSSSETSDQLSDCDDAGQPMQWKTDDDAEFKSEITTDIGWTDVTKTNRRKIILNKKPSINSKLPSNPTPIDCFRLFLTDDVLKYIVEETNKNADCILLNDETSQENDPSQKHTSKEEIEIFIGLLLWMNLVEFPSLDYYWSSDILYKSNISNIMNKNRFETIFRFWPLSKKEHELEDDHSYKVRYIISILVQKFKEIRIPGTVLTICKYNLPIRYSNPQKKHIKIFKLCSADSYTYNLMLYEGKQNFDPTEIVLKICEDYLDNGRVLATDEFFTSVYLADSLLKRNTHLVGTLEPNRKGIPYEVVCNELKRGQIYGKINENGVIIAKWKDKKDFLMLSTYHNLDIVKIEKRNRNGEYVVKPKIVMDYKAGIVKANISHQIPSFIPLLQEFLNWYHKVALEVIFESSVINAYVIHKENNPGLIMTMKKFKEHLIKAMLKIDEYDENKQVKSEKLEHKFEKTTLVTASNRRIRKRCIHCYANIKRVNGSKYAAYAAKKVSTFCSICPDKPFICKECFSFHVDTC